eukprot:Ihof_evm13s2 gene=Ihof_evmTU13s2
MGAQLEDILIVYASQTGNAQAVAEELAETTIERCNIDVRIFNADQVDKKFKLEDEPYVVFICSSTGDGDPPDTATKLWRKLRLRDNNVFLSHLQYAILGLGDTNYSTFNGAAKGLEKKLKSLGASSFLPNGFADDAVGLEKVIEPWSESLWKTLIRLKTWSVSYTTPIIVTAPDDEVPKDDIQSDNMKVAPLEPLPTEGTPSPLILKKLSPAFELLAIEADKLSSDPTDVPRLAAARLSVKITPGYPTPIPSPLPSNLEKLEVPSEAYDMHHPFKSCILSCKRLTAQDAVKKTLQMELDLHGSGIDFQPGDAFGVLCENDYREVNLLLTQLGLLDSADMGFDISILPDSKKGVEIPTSVQKAGTIRSLFTKCLCLRSMPRKAFIRMLAEEASDPQERRQLLLLCSRKGGSLWNSMVESRTYWLTDILGHFPSCKPSLARLIESLPPLFPRFYSAASSPLSHPHSVQFAFNVQSVDGREPPLDQGVCTGWLDRLGGTAEGYSTDYSNHYIWLYPKPSPHFRLPDDSKVPVIMIGPGTGVAPFIGFLHHRRNQQQMAALNSPANSHRQLNDVANIQLEDSTNGQLGHAANQQLSQVSNRISGAGTDHFMWLFFGCRQKKKDYLYQGTLEGMVREGTLTRLDVAFSRDSDLPGIQYVQDLIIVHGYDLTQLLIHRNAHIYVCGDAKNMCKDVDQALVNILMTHE